MLNIELFRRIKLLVCDFDGVFTDNSVIVDENGKESVICSRSDSLGVEMLKKKGINVIVISKERNNVVQSRCQKMGIPCFWGIDEKLSVMQKEMKEYGLEPDEVCYLGNDINDLECMRYVIGVAVGDANDQAKEIARYVTKANGGRGAVREVADHILNSGRTLKESL
ncbi:MAG: HAD hydrolase family protein [Candidatus Omnitrophica bacterium]|nr:HAD hydrolase family protein [Candidatus Omnitrophota bacterium]